MQVAICTNYECDSNVSTDKGLKFMKENVQKILENSVESVHIVVSLIKLSRITVWVRKWASTWKETGSRDLFILMHKT